MSTRRHFVRTAGLAGMATAWAATGAAAWAAAPRASGAPLRWQHFPANEQGFSRAPVLLTGARDAVLIDGGFTLSDGRALADAIRATGKRLTTIYISQSDPDYYFSLAPVRAAFPQAKVLAASDTLRAIHGNVEKNWPPGARSSRTTARRSWPMW
jgi:glyoxylase-like metal-dependent hydrolase (beta-lactamase superfamily II)